MFKLKENIYDIRSVKEAILLNFWSVYGQIWKADEIDTSLEEEIMLNALFKVLDEDTGSREQYEELLGVAYMLQGIGESLRSRYKTGEIIDESDETEPEKEKSNKNDFSLFDNKDWPF